MRNRFFAFVMVSMLVIGTIGGVAARPETNPRIYDPLISLLPASDGVITLDAKRFFGEALPTLLSANQPMLNEVFGKLDEMQAKTGIDLRQFETVAVGIASRRVSAKEIDFEPIAIARGQIKSGALVAIAKLASNGTYREERIGERTVYVFSAKEVAQKQAPKASKAVGLISRAVDGLTKEIAVTAIDPNTLAIGTLPRVRETLQGGSHVEAELIALLARRETAVLSFAAKPPGGMSTFLPLDNDELGKNVDSIRYVSGSVDIISEMASVQMLARTQKPEQAQGLLETLEGLQVVGKALLGSSKGADKQVYGRMIDNVKFARSGSEVSMDLQVPKGDIDILIGAKK